MIYFDLGGEWEWEWVSDLVSKSYRVNYWDSGRGRVFFWVWERNRDCEFGSE